MLILQKFDKKSGFVVGTASVTLLATAAFVIRQIVRAFTFRKDPPMAFFRFGLFGETSKASMTVGPTGTTATPPPPLMPALDPREISRETSPIDPSENSSAATEFASEDVLRRDWISPEEDEAWAHL